MKKTKKAIHPDDDAHYRSMGLTRGTVEEWEDGSRVAGKRGEYEWWYNDAHFPDGTVLVIFFYLKSPKVVYEYVTPAGEEYRITYDRKGDINKTCFVDVLSRPLAALAKLAGFDGGYHRFEGVASIERIENGVAVESITEPAVWELMYFGKSGEDEAAAQLSKN